MRKAIFVAAVALCPMLIHAQVLSPAQPKSADTNPVLVSGLTKSTTAGAVSAITGGVNPDKKATPALAEVVAPRLIQTATIRATNNYHVEPTKPDKLAVVSLIVDRDGKPSSVQMIQSPGWGMDNDVLASVSRYRFQPGTLDREFVPMKVELTIKIHPLP